MVSDVVAFAGLVFPKAVASKHILVLNGVVPVDEMRSGRCTLFSYSAICISHSYSGDSRGHLPLAQICC